MRISKIIVLPLIALIASSCSCSLFPKKDKSTSETTTQESSDPFHNEITTAATVEKGKEHSLPWNINYQLLKSDNGALDYASYHKTYTFDGTNVYCYGLRAVTDISVSVNGTLVPYGNFEIIHLCKVGHEKFPDGGQIQISDLKPTKAVVELVAQKTRSYSASSAPTFYVGNKKITTPGTAITNVSPIHEEFYVHTVTYELNATEAGIIQIKNEQSFSMYIQSIQFE